MQLMSQDAGDILGTSWGYLGDILGSSSGHFSTWHRTAWCHCALYYYKRAPTSIVKKLQGPKTFNLQLRCCKIAPMLPFCTDPLLFPVACCNLFNGMHILLWCIALYNGVEHNCICQFHLYMHLLIVFVYVFLNHICIFICI